MEEARREIEEQVKKLPPLCKRCHRELKDPVSIERGYGEICWKRVERARRERLF